MIKKIFILSMLVALSGCGTFSKYSLCSSEHNYRIANQNEINKLEKLFADKKTSEIKENYVYLYDDKAAFESRVKTIFNKKENILVYKESQQSYYSGWFLYGTTSFNIGFTKDVECPIAITNTTNDDIVYKFR